MRKNIKLLIGTIGLFAITGITIGSVISCSNGNNGSSASNSNSNNINKFNQDDPYNVDNSEKVTAPEGGWTKSTAADNFNDYLNKTYTTKAALNEAITNNAQDFAESTNSLINSTIYNKTRGLISEFTYLNKTYEIKYDNSFKMQSFSQNENDTWDATLVSTSLVSLWDGANEITSNLLDSTQTLKYINMTLTPSVSKVLMLNGDSYSLSNNYYACWVATNWDDLVFSATCTEGTIPTGEAGLFNTATQNIYKQGYIQKTRTESWKSISDVPNSAIFKIIYSSNGGLNYGTLEQEPTTAVLLLNWMNY